MAGRRLAAVCFSVRPNIRHARYRTVRDSFDSSMAETSLAILCTSRPLALALPPEALPRPNLIQMRVPLAPLSPPPKECPEASRRRLLQASKPHRCQAPEETSENPAPMAKRERESTSTSWPLQQSSAIAGLGELRLRLLLHILLHILLHSCIALAVSGKLITHYDSNFC